MLNLSPDDRARLGAMLAGRAAVKARDAEDAESRNRSSALISSLRQDAEWCRSMALIFLSDDDITG